MPADFLDLPTRRPKPRTAGLTHVLDPGAGPALETLRLGLRSATAAVPGADVVGADTA